MTRAESKYFNTALLMDQSLLLLLEKKDLEFITVKEICQRAGVNRSTFYLHYENVNGLLEETIEMINQEFSNSFSIKDITKTMQSGRVEDLVFIKEEFIVPYLEFVKKNLRILKAIHNRPILFKTNKVYKEMCEKVFYPILTKFNIPDSKKPYILNFYTKGVTGIVNQWTETNCKEPIENIVQIIIDCVGFNKK